MGGPQACGPLWPARTVTITGDYWAITCDYLQLLTITQRLLVSSSVGYLLQVEYTEK